MGDVLDNRTDIGVFCRRGLAIIADSLYFKLFHAGMLRYIRSRHILRPAHGSTDAATISLSYEINDIGVLSPAELRRIYHLSFGPIIITVLLWAALLLRMQTGQVVEHDVPSSCFFLGLTSFAIIHIDKVVRFSFDIELRLLVPSPVELWIMHFSPLSYFDIRFRLIKPIFALELFDTFVHRTSFTYLSLLTGVEVSPPWFLNFIHFK